MKKCLIFILSTVCLLSCADGSGQNDPKKKRVPTNDYLVDRYADPSVLKLHELLSARSRTGTMLGQHETNAYGVGWKYDGVNQTSDIRKVTGRMPALYGWDFSGIDKGLGTVIDGIPVAEVSTLVREAHKQGGVQTFCWHAYNPLTGNDSWQVDDTTVGNILPGREGYKKFRRYVERIAAYAKSLRDNDGNPIPILFRPWHEHTGNWFWWGSRSCSANEFQQLWRTTVTLLRDTLDVHNFIYVYSSDIVSSREQYLERYPGDLYVDVLGFDAYQHNTPQQYVSEMARMISIVRTLGQERRKLYAVTETGSEGVKNADWFTHYFYPAIKNQGLAYFMLWRNADTSHHYVPYPGHPAADDFAEFAGYDDILMLSDLGL